jgi:hypothetical protein
MKGAMAIQRTLPDDLLSNPVMNRFFEAFLSVEIHVLLRFGKYREVLAKPVPTNEVRHFPPPLSPHACCPEMRYRCRI